MNALKWTPEDVSKKLNHIGLGKYSNTFLSSKIAGKDLFSLSDSQLREIGMTAAHRSTFNGWIRSIHQPVSGRKSIVPKAIIKAPVVSDTYRVPTKKVYTFKQEEEVFDLKDLSFAPPPQVKRIPKRISQLRSQKFDVPMNGNDEDRVPCHVCGRLFAKERISTHENICMRTHNKKRRVFNSQKQRLKGTEIPIHIRQNYNPPPKKLINGRPKYVVEHEELVAAIRAARGIKVIQTKPSISDDRVKCPHCNRKFGRDVAKKHISICSQNSYTKPRLSSYKKYRD